MSGLLASVGLDLSAVLLMRHRPEEGEVRRALPTLAQEHPDLFLAYHRSQRPSAERSMLRARFVVSLIGQESGKATFAAIYEVQGSRTITHQDYRELPGNVALREEFGMEGQGPERSELLLFDLVLRPELSDWRGRLVLDWPPSRAWARWLTPDIAPVHAITEESKLREELPAWDELSLSWRELKGLPFSWRAKLSQWRGVYYIFDAERRLGYVGSATGAENILGRWTGYAASGHGGNLLLRQSRPEDLRFSILELTAPTSDPEQVLQRETLWKKRLHTRTGGLNAN